MITDDDITRVFNWLGQRSHNRAKKRRAAPLFERHRPDAPLIDQWFSLVMPWSTQSYPSKTTVLNAMFGTRKNTGGIRSWRVHGVPRYAAAKLAAFLESRIVREQMLVVLLRDRAAEQRDPSSYYYSRDLSIDERALIKRRGLAMRQQRSRDRRAAGKKRDGGFASMPAERLAEVSRRGVEAAGLVWAARRLEKASSDGVKIPARESVRSVPDKKGDSD